MSKEKYRSRVHMVLLYPEDASHVAALEKIKQSYDYVGILHDKDYWTDDDESSNSNHIAGELKKEHYHVILRFKQAVWNTAVCKDLGIADNYIEQVKKFDNAILYLIHYNDTDKAQYSPEEVFGNLKTKLNEAINKGVETEGERVIDIISFIDTQDRYIRVKDLAVWCAENGYWSEFRRSASIIMRIVDEHNSSKTCQNEE